MEESIKSIYNACHHKQQCIKTEQQRDQLLSTIQDIANSAKYLQACKAKDEILAAVSGVI